MSTVKETSVLIIDDDHVDRMRLRRYLKKSTTLGSVIIREAVDLASGQAALGEEAFDVLLLDFQLPDGDGLSFLRRHQNDAIQLPPVILQTVLNDEEVGVQAMEAGAQDYLVKGLFDPHTLVRSIRYARERHRLLTEQNRLVLELKESLSRVKRLEGIIPICMVCKKIRDDEEGYWEKIEEYMTNHTDAMFSHGVCPDCADTYEKKMFSEDSGE